jgi:phage tail sheath protein FI
VFTRERDLSFLPQGIADIGACIIGPTLKGPAFVPTTIRSFPEFEEMFGSTSKNYYTPYAVEQYLRSAGTVTIVRVLNTDGYSADSLSLYLSGSSFTKKTVAVLLPSRGGSSGTADLEGSNVTGSWSSATLVLSGSNWGAKSLTSRSYTISFDTGSANYIENVFSTDPQVQKSGQNTVSAYLYKNFKYAQSSNGYSANAAITASHGTHNLSVTYANAATPYIQSQTINNSKYDLFKVQSRSHGSDVNNKYKVVILNVKKAGSIAGSDYGSFSLQLRQTGLNDNNLTKDNILEQWDGLNFDPTSPNYFAKRIGDRYVTIASDGKLTYNGDWPNMSKHIYVSDFTDIAEKASPVSVVPMGHAAVNNPFGSDDSSIPAWTVKTSQSNAQGEFDANEPFGVDYSNADAEQYLAPVNSFGNGANATMSIEDFNGSSDASTTGATYSDGTEKITLALSNIKQRKFVVPFQGGFDGENPANPKLTGASIVNTNTQGFDCSTSSTGGTVAYKKAINSVSNADEFDINMLVTPGIVHGLHSKITNHAISKCEARGDAFYVLDCGIQGGTIASATSAVSALDTNYAATYYPWVKIVDRNTSLPVWVPPSVVLPGVIAYTDQVAHEWFAPAGLNRGGLTTVLEAQTRLTHSERDDLYEERVNPIASFPGQGVVVWGQKTLQGRPSALDRVNVRRLLIKLKKFIASSSRYLVFEQNTTATRNRFLNIVNPFLESVQANSGLSAFRVVMDDSNNTPDVVDRNQLVGQIFIQPTRTAEFIVLDFVVQPTGAAFPE